MCQNIPKDGKVMNASITRDVKPRLTALRHLQRRFTLSLHFSVVFALWEEGRGLLKANRRDLRLFILCGSALISQQPLSLAFPFLYYLLLNFNEGNNEGGIVGPCTKKPHVLIHCLFIDVYCKN